jgi:Transposase and inactivated derivatives
LNKSCFDNGPDPSDWREARRFRAYELKQEGWRQTDIAEALGVSEGAAGQWMKKAREGGKQALKTSPRPGRPPKLSEEERTERLPSLLEKGPRHFGFRGMSGLESASERSLRRNLGSSTTCLRSVGPEGIRDGWSRQKPGHRSDRRDKEAIEEWKEKEWPRIKKSRD